MRTYGYVKTKNTLENRGNCRFTINNRLNDSFIADSLLLNCLVGPRPHNGPFEQPKSTYSTSYSARGSKCVTLQNFNSTVTFRLLLASSVRYKSAPSNWHPNHFHLRIRQKKSPTAQSIDGSKVR